MSKTLLALGSITIVIATTLLIFNQDESRPPLLATPTLSNSTTSSETFPKQNETTLVPLLPSLSKPLTSTTDLSLKAPLPEAKPSSQPIAVPRESPIKPRQFVTPLSEKLSSQKPLPIVRPTLKSSIESRQLLPTELAESSSTKLTPVFTHRSRAIIPPIIYPVVPTEPLATPTAISTPTPVLSTPSTPTAPLITPTPTPVLSTPSTPTAPLITPTPTPVLSTY